MPHRPLVAAFTVLYMLVFGGWAVATGNHEFLFYAAIMLGLIGMVLLLDRQVTFSPLVLWGLATWGLLHMAGGTVPIPQSVTEPGGLPKLYSLRVVPWFIKYDQFVHAFGFGVATLAAWEGLRAATGYRRGPGFGLAILLVCIGMGLGALNEVVEFTATRIMPETNVGGYVNTGWDLVSNLTGCVLAVAWLVWRGDGQAR
ncbi:MAG: DUF2238 domain-containing protein [Phycisphaerales bacterium]|nr:DUF2238 domain-containing protein [Phycisphaerales bacterium]